MSKEKSPSHIVVWEHGGARGAHLYKNRKPPTGAHWADVTLVESIAKASRSREETVAAAQRKAARMGFPAAVLILPPA